MQDYVAPQSYSYADFPEATDNPTGMKTLKVSLMPNYPHVELNVPYAVKNGITLHLHIITPASVKGSARYPLIMWVQGSAFHKQKLGEHMSHMVEVAKHGFIVAMVEYRWAPESPFPAQIKDLKTATRFMLRHASQYHVDADHYLAWGDSSGGHTVSAAVVTANIPEFNDEDVAETPLNYKCCIDFYGPTDISQMNKVPSTQDHIMPHSLEGEFFGIKHIYEVPELVQKSNPITYISGESLPPFLIMHGNKDRLVPFRQSVLFYEALKAHHKDVVFYKVDQSDHGTDAFFTPEALKSTFDFIEKTLN
ncbi:alpha/beta hydrolase fold domain-containing protein [Liquorilactobacillus mali]|nr:alpha/beta hydrolase fold domain-containing protein [Liquorilactobacillus mali]